MPGEELDWSLLPRQPEAFFGLAKGWDRRDLKRSYNRLIKLYRPEREPERFRQIRAAYEQLTETLEWRETIKQVNEESDESPSDPMPNWDLGPSEDSAEQFYFDSIPPTPPRQGPVDYDALDGPVPDFEIRVPLDKVMAEEYGRSGGQWGRARTQALNLLDAGASIEDILKGLEAEPVALQDEENFWLRAHLADLIDPSGQRIFECMIKGLKKFPTSELLAEMLGEFLDGRDDAQDPVELLAYARKHLHEHTHYTVLLPLWLNVLEAQPALFWQLLQQTQPSFHLHRSFTEMLMAIIGKHALDLPLEKFQQILAQINHSQDQLSPVAEEHLDYLHGLLVYREAREKSPPQTDGMMALDEVIFDYADLQSNHQTTRSILLDLSQNMHSRWFNAQFPVDHPLLVPASELLLLMSHQLNISTPQLAENYERPEELNNRLNQQIYTAFKETDGLRTGFAVWRTIVGRMAYKSFFNFIAPLLTIYVASLFFKNFFEVWFFLVFFVSFIGFVLTYKYWLSRYEFRIGQKAVLERDRIYYRDYWRVYLLEFIAKSKATVTITYNLLRVNGQPDAPSLLEYASNDPGLSLFATLSSLSRERLSR